MYWSSFCLCQRVLETTRTTINYLFRSMSRTYNKGARPNAVHPTPHFSHCLPPEPQGDEPVGGERAASVPSTANRPITSRETLRSGSAAIVPPLANNCGATWQLQRHSGRTYVAVTVSWRMNIYWSGPTKGVAGETLLVLLPGVVQSCEQASMPNPPFGISRPVAQFHLETIGIKENCPAR